MDISSLTKISTSVKNVERNVPPFNEIQNDENKVDIFQFIFVIRTSDISLIQRLEALPPSKYQFHADQTLSCFDTSDIVVVVVVVAAASVSGIRCYRKDEVWY